MAVRYINDRFLPDKAIDIIDEVASRVRLSGCGKAPEITQLELDIRELLKAKEEAVKQANLCSCQRAAGKTKRGGSPAAAEKEKANRSRNRRSLTVDEAAVAKIVSDWTKIPVQRLTEGETRRLANLEKELHKRVIGQEEAVAAVAQAVKRGRVGLKDPGRPIGPFCFWGRPAWEKQSFPGACAGGV